MSTTVYYTILTRTTTFMISNALTFLSGLISIASFWIGCSFNSKKNYAILPILMVFLIVSIILLSISVAIGYSNKSRLEFDYSTKSPKLLRNADVDTLHEAVFRSMGNYNDNSTIRGIWDAAQKRFKCCGTNGASDWISLNHEIPKSCCANAYCTDNWDVKDGCLDAIVFELIWKVSLILGLSCIDLGLKAFMLCILSYIYFTTLCTNLEEI